MPESKHLKRIPQNFADLLEFGQDRLNGKSIRLLRALVERYLKDKKRDKKDLLDPTVLNELYCLLVRTQATRVSKLSVPEGIIEGLIVQKTMPIQLPRTAGWIDRKTGVTILYTQFHNEEQIYSVVSNDGSPLDQVSLYLGDVMAFLMNDEYEEHFTESPTVEVDEERRIAYLKFDAPPSKKPPIH